MLKKIGLVLLALSLSGCGTQIETVYEESLAFVQTALEPTTEETPAPTYPLAPIDLVLPLEEGSGGDLWGQVMGLYMGAELDVEVVGSRVTQRNTQWDVAWEAPHDGYTMVSVSEDLASLPVLAETTQSIQNWSYFLTSGVPGVLWVNRETALAGYDTMEAVVTGLEADQESLTLGGASSGLWYLISQCLLEAQPFYWLSYDTSGDAITACLEGKTNAVVAFPSEVMSYVQTGDLVAVAVLDSQDWDIETVGTVTAVTQAMPELEAQFPLMQVQGFAVTADTDAQTLDILQQGFARVMIHPEITAYGQTQHCVLLGLSGQEAQDFMTHLASQLCWRLHNVGQSVYHPEDAGIAPIS